jgi:VanZ family protein
MQQTKAIISRWGPSLLWMAAIFISSSTPSSDLPSFGSLDYVVKKTGHFLGYAVLALAYRRGLGWELRRSGTAWILAVLHALVDEFHQSFVPGRHPSLVDALLFDAGGAAAALWVSGRLSGTRRSLTADDSSGSTKH